MPSTIPVTNLLDSGAGSLRAAITDANALSGDDTIVFDSGLTGNINLASALPDLSSNIDIQGSGATVRRDSGGDYRIFKITIGTTVAISGLTISNGKYVLVGGPADTFGGGIDNDGTLTLINCTVSENVGYWGGGIFNEGTLSLTNSTVAGNSAVFGAGIYNGQGHTMTLTNSTVAGNFGIGILNDGILTLTNSTVSGNSADHAGGIWIMGTATLINSTVSGNSAGGDGGGLVIGGTATLINSTVSGNSADRGGGIHIGQTATLSIINSTVSGNTAIDGGGIYNYFLGTVTLTNSTVSGNSADDSSGGIYNEGTLTLTNSTVSGNSAIDGGGIYNYSFSTLTLNNTIVANSILGEDIANFGTVFGSHNLIEDGSGGLADTISGDPNLSPLFDNGGPTQSHALLSGSNAINAGDNTLAVDANGDPLTTDQRGSGFARISGGAVDIGAFEIPNSPPVAADDSASTNEDDAVTITVLGNDSEPDGDALTITAVTSPGNGAATANADGTITYTPAGNFNGTDSFSYTITDGNGEFASATVDVSVVAFNDAPELTVPGAQTTVEDVAVMISGISVADVDVNEGTGDMQVTLSVASGTLTVSTFAAAGLTAAQVTSNGTGMVVLQGPIDAVNVTLAAGVTYLGNLNFSGDDTLSIHADDLGNTGLPGPQTADATVSIQVQSPAEQVANLQALVEALHTQGALNQGQANALLTKLAFIELQVVLGKTHVAYNMAGAFLNQVLDLIAADVLTHEEGDPLVAAVEQLRAGLLLGGGF